MDNKTLSIISYITLVGWLVAFFVGKDNANSLLKTHLKQSLGIMITTFVVGFGITILAAIVPILGSLLMVLQIVYLVLIIIGILNAVKGENKTLPIIGDFFQEKLSFIDNYNKNS